MVEEAQTSEASVTMPPENPTPNLNPTSNEGTIESNALGGGVESTCNNNSNNTAANAASSVVTTDGESEKSLELADELMEKGSKAIKDNDLNEAVDCFSRALEIRVAHYGELSPECVSAYYKYGCALLYKAQDEADPLGGVPKKENGSRTNTDTDGSVKSSTNGETSVTSIASNAEQGGSSSRQEGAEDDVSSGKGQEEDEEDNDDQELAEADEDESDLDFAWKMLDIARAIVEKQSVDTTEKVDILSKLAEVSMEREDIETALSDYKKALSILEQLVGPDDRFLAELNFRICLCLELGSKPEEALLYCQKAISICKSRLERLKTEVDSLSEPTVPSTESEKDAHQSTSLVSATEDAVAKKKEEIQTLIDLLGDLEKKLEDLQQLAANPKSILSDILGIVAAKARGNDNGAPSAMVSSSRMGTANSSGDFDSPTVSTAHTTKAPEVTHLGVVGRGVKRVHMSSGTADSSSKKPALEPSNAGDGNSS